MTALAVALAACAALLMVPVPPGRRLVAVGSLAPGRDRRGRPPPDRRRVVAALAGLAVGVLVGGATGLLLGAAVAAGTHRWLRGLASSSEVRAAAAVVRDLPLALDLLAACIGAGAAPADALAAVGPAVGGDLGRLLSEVAHAAALGAASGHAWALALGPDAPAPLRECAARFASVQTSGAALAPALTRLAAEQRRTAVVAARARASRAGVVAVAPLGLCFLPAFVLLGVVPMVAGLLGQLP